MNDDLIFYKENDSDEIWWVEDEETIGQFKFSFDRMKIYNLFADYPHNMTDEEVKIFDKENPRWAEFFSDRK